MEYFIISFFALSGSLLTFFSGFGLGTILTPVFALFFPLQIALTLTAIVHFLNNVFKFSLIGKHANKKVVLQFGLPAIGGALVGAWVLGPVTDSRPLLTYFLFGLECRILPVKLLMGILIIFFTLFELMPALKNWSAHPKYLSFGGVLSGFFGGLSGHQGALRSAFLSRLGLGKEEFVATGNVIALMIDLSRLLVYSQLINQEFILPHLKLLGVVTLSAFLGAYLGGKFLKKMTLHSLQMVVSICLLFLAVLLSIGLI